MADKNSNMLAALGALIGIVGLILFFVKAEDKHVKFYSAQSVVLSVAMFVVQFVLAITIVGLILLPVVWIAWLAALIMTTVKAWKGEHYKLPFLGEFSEGLAK
ncbi:MAG: DUF4870 domain-containing protein [Candidatus Diapherotrites archaeon]|nr:DUF4870 domain-containing protein [Candidatus Diapherotrites archaeon]